MKNRKYLNISLLKPNTTCKRTTTQEWAISLSLPSKRTISSTLQICTSRSSMCLLAVQRPTVCTWPGTANLSSDKSTSTNQLWVCLPVRIMTIRRCCGMKVTRQQVLISKRSNKASRSLTCLAIVPRAILSMWSWWTHCQPTATATNTCQVCASSSNTLKTTIRIRLCGNLRVAASKMGRSLTTHKPRLANLTRLTKLFWKLDRSMIARLSSLSLNRLLNLWVIRLAIFCSYFVCCSWFVHWWPEVL